MAYQRGEDGLFRSSLANDPDSELVPQSQLLDPSNYKEKTVPAFDETDYQSHRNVYVGIHVPYSRSKHKHRGRRKSGNGQGKHGRSHRRSSDISSTLEEVSLDGESLSLGGIEERRRSSFHGQSSEQEGLPKRPSYHKSVSAPSSRPRTPPPELATLPTIIEPRTPADPCDRVKFILGGDEIDYNSHSNGKHSVFTELEELKYDEHDHKMEWKETARWIKFEEDVEEGGNKWSKPHVATLSLHSLFELRSCLVKGTVLLDMQADNLTHISDHVVENLVSSGQLEECFRDKVRCALLQKHKHLNSRKEHHENKLLDHIRSLGEIGRLGSSTSKQMDAEVASINGAAPNTEHNGSTTGGFGGFALSAPTLFGSRLSSQRPSLANGSTAETRLGEESNGSSDPDLSQANKPGSFMKKIPPGSEASNVLVGEVDFLSHPIIAFVRLATSQVLGDLTEIPIPTRFLFILLGPKGNQERFHEIGRSIATLMSDEVFHEVAYKARNRGDLLAGIDEFLDKVTVLPPGEWDPEIRLAPPEKVPSQDDRRTANPKPNKEHTGSCKKMERKSRQPPVNWSKRPFRGLVDDLFRCYSLYRSDILDAFSIQGLASLILIYFANITLAFTFGAFLSDITKGSLGATEMILAVGIGNLVFSIFSGQPLVILGATGPTIIFEQIIFNFCDMYGIPFLNFRFWIGLWTTLIMIGLVAFNTSAVMRLFTRFTEEIFTAVVGFIFIYEAFARLWTIHMDHPYNQWVIYPTKARVCDCFQFPSLTNLEALDMTNATNLGSYWSDPGRNCSPALLRSYVGDQCNGKSIFLNHDVFLMSVILFFGTFLLCYYIKAFNHTRFFKTFIRKLVSDFAVFISVVVWVIVDVLAQVNTPKLVVNNVFNEGVFTQANRTSIFIDPLGNDLPSWAPPAAIIPALLATILLFVDQHITALIVNRKDNKLKKGPGYHLDLLIIGCLIFLHSALGLPWVVGATVVSISHVQSLYLYSPCTAPGERPKFLGVREQRVTLFVCAILVGLSVMAYSALKLLPLPVLYGLLLYMGVASLYGVQFIERIKLFFIPSKRRPDCEYFRRIPNYRIHIYTVIQLGFFVVLCVFQGVNQLKVAFPVMVLTLLLGRWMLGFCFPHSDLDLLDDPLPKELYCRRFREESLSKDVESGAAGLEESEDHTDNGEIPPININDVVTSEPVGEQGPPSARNALFGVKKNSDFNITREMDKCDLWRNLVKNYDTPPLSPRRSAKNKGDAPVITIEESDETQHQPISQPSACRRLQYQSTAV